MEISIILSALGFGFLSGFHCIGMCGPIALSMGLTKKQAANFYVQNLTYQFGRIFTYAVLGAIVGLIGVGFQLTGFQKQVTIFAGILLIIVAVFSFGGQDFSNKVPFLSKFLFSVKMNLGKLLQKADYKSRFLTGILNGFLPCGMVYAALTASIAAGGIWQGASFMVLFGLGTFPFMFAVVLAGNLISQTFRLKILKLVPVLMIILGGLFIVRGLELGIPYLSPKAEVLQIHNPNEKASMKNANCH